MKSGMTLYRVVLFLTLVILINVLGRPGIIRAAVTTDRQSIVVEPGPLSLRDGAESHLDHRILIKIERLIAETMRDSEIPGVAVGIVKDGQVVYTRGFGLAEQSSDRLLTTYTHFPVGSLSKLFTVVAIMQLVESGQLDLDTPITTYLPHFYMADARYQQITIRHLLTQTAGLSAPPEQCVSRNGDRAAVLHDLAGGWLAGPPGEAGFLEARTNFILLEAAIELVSGEAYADYLKGQILHPLRMRHSAFRWTELDSETVTARHWRGPAGDLITSRYLPGDGDQPVSGSELWSTIEDLSRWAAANLNQGELNGVRILTPESYEQLWVPMSGHRSSLGGLFQDYGSMRDGYWLTGWIGVERGLTTSLILAPDQASAVVTVVDYTPTETTDPPWLADDIGQQIMAILLGIDDH